MPLEADLQRARDQVDLGSEGGRGVDLFHHRSEGHGDLPEVLDGDGVEPVVGGPTVADLARGRAPREPQVALDEEGDVLRGNHLHPDRGPELVAVGHGHRLADRHELRADPEAELLGGQVELGPSVEEELQNAVLGDQEQRGVGAQLGDLLVRTVQVEVALGHQNGLEAGPLVGVRPPGEGEDGDQGDRRQGDAMHRSLPSFRNIAALLFTIKPYKVKGVKTAKLCYTPPIWKQNLEHY